MTYESSAVVPSERHEGVCFTVAKMSFVRRLELMRRVRELASRMEFFAAGKGEKNELEAAILSSEIDQLYLVWGLREVTGLVIDGEPATPESLAGSGPEDLMREALSAVKSECGLSEAERKN